MQIHDLEDIINVCLFSTSTTSISVRDRLQLGGGGGGGELVHYFFFLRVEKGSSMITYQAQYYVASVWIGKKEKQMIFFSSFVRISPVEKQILGELKHPPPPAAYAYDHVLVYVHMSLSIIIGVKIDTCSSLIWFYIMIIVWMYR